ncbi:MAG: response regulator [Rhodothermales bacterium]
MKPRILIAEDNEINQRLMRLMLSRMGYSARMVGDGKAVVKVALEEPWDVIFMDLHMPELDGVEAARRILAAYNDENTPTPGPRPRIYAMTAGVLDADRERCHAAGMDGFIAKPVDKEALREVLG